MRTLSRSGSGTQNSSASSEFDADVRPRAALRSASDRMPTCSDTATPHLGWQRATFPRKGAVRLAHRTSRVWGESLRGFLSSSFGAHASTEGFVRHDALPRDFEDGPHQRLRDPRQRGCNDEVDRASATLELRQGSAATQGNKTPNEGCALVPRHRPLLRWRKATRTKRHQRSASRFLHNALPLLSAHCKVSAAPIASQGLGAQICPRPPSSLCHLPLSEYCRTQVPACCTESARTCLESHHGSGCFHGAHGVLDMAQNAHPHRGRPKASGPRARFNLRVCSLGPVLSAPSSSKQSGWR